MGRPLKDGLEYFWHGSNARNDPKIRRLRSKFGNDGYAAYFVILEIIYDQAAPLLMDADTREYVVSELGMPAKEFDAIIIMCIAVGLFDEYSYKTDNVLTSRKIESTIKDTLHDREYGRRIYTEKLARNHREIGRETTPETGKHSIAKNRREKDSSNGRFHPAPSQDDIQAQNDYSLACLEAKNRLKAQGIEPNQDQIRAEVERMRQ